MGLYLTDMLVAVKTTNTQVLLHTLICKTPFVIQHWQTLYSLDNCPINLTTPHVIGVL